MCQKQERLEIRPNRAFNRASDSLPITPGPSNRLSGRASPEQRHKVWERKATHTSDPLPQPLKDSLEPDTLGSNLMTAINQLHGLEHSFNLFIYKVRTDRRVLLMMMPGRSHTRHIITTQRMFAGPPTAAPLGPSFLLSLPLTANQETSPTSFPAPQKLPQPEHTMPLTDTKGRWSPFTDSTPQISTAP